MRFASIALQTIVVLMMSGSAVAGPREFAGSPDDSADLDRLRRIISPHIEGDTLIIEGRIDSHIYDYIQYEAPRVAAVRVIDLNSLGGNAEWALEIARKLKELGKTTLLQLAALLRERLRLYLRRRTRADGRRGYLDRHSRRAPRAGLHDQFRGALFRGPRRAKRVRAAQDRLPGVPRSLVRGDAGEHQRSFRHMESNGVSPDLRETYFAMPDDPEWPAQMNALRKPDWPISAADAVKYNLATRVLAKTNF